MSVIVVSNRVARIKPDDPIAGGLAAISFRSFATTAISAVNEMADVVRTELRKVQLLRPRRGGSVRGGHSTSEPD